MNTICMLICMISIFLIIFLFSDRNLINPIVIFCIPLIISVLYGLQYYSEWKYNVSVNTAVVVVSSFLVFCIVVYLLDLSAKKIYLNQDGKEILSKKDSSELTKDSIYVCLFGLLVVAAAITFYEERKLVLANGYGGSLSEVIGGYNDLTKFSDTGVTPSGLASLISGFMQGMAYILGYLFVMDRVYGERRRYKIVLFALTVMSLMVSGSRTNAVALLIGAIIMYFIIRSKANKPITIRNANAGFAIFIPLAVVLVLIGFFESLTLLGRNEETDFFYYIAIYLSAPMRNLDLAISNGIVHSDFWGQLTFKYLYPTLEKINVVPSEASYGAFPYISFNGYFLGNVYTTFYAFIVDFGFIGCLAAVAIMGLMSQCTFLIASYSRSSYSIAVILYAYMAFQLFLSFFSSNFYQNIFNTGFLKFLIPIILFKCFVDMKLMQKR